MLTGQEEEQQERLQAQVYLEGTDSQAQLFSLVMPVADQTHSFWLKGGISHNGPEEHEPVLETYTCVYMRKAWKVLETHATYQHGVTWRSILRLSHLVPCLATLSGHESIE